MNGYRISNTGTARIFSSSVLEKLTRTPFVFPVALYYVVAAGSLLYAFYYTEVRVIRLSYLFPLGMFAFTLFEYLIHRNIFHFNATTDRQRAIRYTIHGVHHEFPRDKDRLALPIILSGLVAIFFFFVFRFLMGDYGLLFFSGFSAGYSTYLVIHYAIHRFRPPSNFLRYLWKHHSLHHYKSEESAFGVTFPFWDHVFGTLPEKDPGAQNRLPDHPRAK